MLHLLRRRSSIFICICLFVVLTFRSLFASIKIQSSKLSVTEDLNKLNLNNSIDPIEKAQILMEVGSLVGDKTLHFCPLFFINFMRNNDQKVNEPELSSYNKGMCKKQRGPQCEAKYLQGPLKVSKEILSMEWLHKNELSFVKTGGWYMPTGCDISTRTAIIIPFRNREQHLPVMLRQLHAVLRNQQIHYRIFVIEQSDEHPFNRGKIRNIGFKEALRYFPYTCFVFHDVDLVPENDGIFYDCRKSPAHMSVAVDTLGYMPLQYEHFGGVVSTTKAHFELANGYSNIFWQWGGEDDNVSHRLRKNGLKIHRQPKNVARYKMLSHTPAKREVQLARTVFWTEATKYGDIDGLNSLNYRLLNRTDELLFTRIQVDVLKKVF
ncbi:beta-1,4-N-acetylgalactosaminyltransferase bre-4-like [Clytia hemisphaerica]|uniref:Beta-1,4-galactosyltransferase n=1 Tax=Clytia hemisphaerica TaxID=252671 RepID=A0A7M5V6Z9_9CNID